MAVVAIRKGPPARPGRLRPACTQPPAATPLRLQVAEALEFALRGLRNAYQMKGRVTADVLDRHRRNLQGVLDGASARAAAAAAVPALPGA